VRPQMTQSLRPGHGHGGLPKGLLRDLHQQRQVLRGGGERTGGARRGKVKRKDEEEQRKKKGEMRAGEEGASAPSAVNTLAWTQQSAHRANVILRANVRACVCGARSAARDGWLARCDPRASYIGLLEVLGRHVVGARGCLALLLARSFPHPGRLFVFVRARWGKNCLWRAAAGPGGVLPKAPAHRVLRRRPVAHGTAWHALALEDAGCGHTRGVTPGVPEACGGRDIPDFSVSWR